MTNEVGTTKGCPTVHYLLLFQNDLASYHPPHGEDITKGAFFSHGANMDIEVMKQLGQPFTA